MYESVKTWLIPTFLTIADTSVKTNSNTIEIIAINGFLLINHKEKNNTTKSTISKRTKEIVILLNSIKSFAAQVKVQINKKTIVFFSNILSPGDTIFNNKYDDVINDK